MIGIRKALSGLRFATNGIGERSTAKEVTQAMRFNIKAFAAACGIVWGLWLFLVSWWVILFEGPKGKQTWFLGRIYRGYKATPIGSLFGLLWGLVEGAIGGGMFACLYNEAAKHMPQKIEIEV
jgi:hypothetical protein